MNISEYIYKPDLKAILTKSGKADNIPSNFHPDLTIISDRKEYFRLKASKEIASLQKFFKNNTFISYVLAPNMAGKSTHINMLAEALGDTTPFQQVIVGDLVRNADEEFRAKGKKSNVYKYFQKYYRGYVSIDDLFQTLIDRKRSTLLPTELILNLIKMEIDRIGHKTIFIDGFPRNLDQISYSLFFKELINYRNDPDCFLSFYLPIGLIDARIKSRVVCPKCAKSRNTRFIPTEFVAFDPKTKETFLQCDNPECKRERMIVKEGDALGTQTIADRVVVDLELMEKVKTIHGIPQINVYNAVPVKDAPKYVEDYELTLDNTYTAQKDGTIKRTTKPFIFTDHGVDYHSLLPAQITLQLIKQLAEIYGEK